MVKVSCDPPQLVGGGDAIVVGIVGVGRDTAQGVGGLRQPAAGVVTVAGRVGVRIGCARHAIPAIIDGGRDAAQGVGNTHHSVPRVILVSGDIAVGIGYTGAVAIGVVPVGCGVAQGIGHISAVARGVVNVSGGIPSSVGLGEQIAAAVVGVSRGLSQRVHLIGAVAAGIVLICGYTAIRVGHAGHLIENRLVGVSRHIAQGVRGVGAVALSVVLIAGHGAIGIGGGGNQPGGSVIGVRGRGAVGRDNARYIAVGVVRVISNVAEAVGLCRGAREVLPAQRQGEGVAVHRPIVGVGQREPSLAQPIQDSERFLVLVGVEIGPAVPINFAVELIQRVVAVAYDLAVRVGDPHRHPEQGIVLDERRAAQWIGDGRQLAGVGVAEHQGAAISVGDLDEETVAIGEAGNVLVAITHLDQPVNGAGHQVGRVGHEGKMPPALELVSDEIAAVQLRGDGLKIARVGGIDAAAVEVVLGHAPVGVHAEKVAALLEQEDVVRVSPTEAQPGVHLSPGAIGVVGIVGESERERCTHAAFDRNHLVIFAKISLSETGSGIAAGLASAAAGALFALIGRIAADVGGVGNVGAPEQSGGQHRCSRATSAGQPRAGNSAPFKSDLDQWRAAGRRAPGYGALQTLRGSGGAGAKALPPAPSSRPERGEPSERQRGGIWFGDVADSGLGIAYQPDRVNRIVLKGDRIV